MTMRKHSCGACTFRARYDHNPKSILGRLWRWHIRFCPGWKSYLKSLPDPEQAQLREQYGLPVAADVSPR